ncbi:hypothetical protein WJX72_005287 [[Myrmecia] bisecta]|uniref:Uncharacterized protein n=1 Tax=[Myrmecia] bisecta TaxID=41462 RepID=A0AAW1Q6V9_9CHLO
MYFAKPDKQPKGRPGPKITERSAGRGQVKAGRLQSKAAIAAQAEANTRILERERAALAGLRRDNLPYEAHLQDPPQVPGLTDRTAYGQPASAAYTDQYGSQSAGAYAEDPSHGLRTGQNGYAQQDVGGSVYASPSRAGRGVGQTAGAGTGMPGPDEPSFAAPWGRAEQQVHAGAQPKQFMSALAGLHGSPSKETLDAKERARQQYVHELDMQDDPMLDPYSPNGGGGVAAVMGRPELATPARSPEPSPGGRPSPPGRTKPFMASMSELRGGPSDDQRRHAELQRAKLVKDLEEQVRQRREAEAARKAAARAAELKEERDIQAYYERLAQQNAHANRQQLSPVQDLPQDDILVGPTGSLHRPPPEPPQPSLPAPPADQHSQAAPDAASSQVTSMLQQLQLEQVRLREQFAKQAESMSRMQQEAETAARERDRARDELARVQGMLARSADSLDEFVVDTQLVPANINHIPPALPAAPQHQPGMRDSRASPLRRPQRAMASGNSPDGAHHRSPPQHPDQLGRGMPQRAQQAQQQEGPGRARWVTPERLEREGKTIKFAGMGDSGVLPRPRQAARDRSPQKLAAVSSSRPKIWRG